MDYVFAPIVWLLGFVVNVVLWLVWQLLWIVLWLVLPIVLASETEASTIFGDCELGSVPPVAGAYDLMAVIDDSLEGSNDIYFEGGDHRTLVHLTGGNFQHLMQDVPHAHIGARNRG